MTKNEIRVQYSGFIIFAARIVSVATGLAFTVMLTRSTKPDELGIWGNASNDVLAYFTFLASALPFWAMRFTARGKEGSIKTGVVANLAISIIATAIYLPAVPIIMSLLHISEIYMVIYLIASIQIIENYLISILEGCLRAIRPQTIGYGLLFEEFFKILIAYILIIRLQQPLLGAIISLSIGFAIQIAYYLKLLSKELLQPIRWNYVKEWLKGSTVNVYYIIGDRIAALVFIMLFSWSTLGQDARGIYLAAVTIANVITYSSFLSFALYPKLLAESNARDVTTSLRSVLMFATPMAVGAIALSDSYLIMMNETYGPAAVVLMVLAINYFVQTMSQFFSPVLYGFERIDEKASIPLRELVRSPLFKAFTLPYLHSAIELPTIYYLLTNFVKDPISAALYVSIVDTVTRVVTFLALYIIIWRIVKIEIPWVNITKYISASAVMALFLFLIPHPTRLTLIFGVTIMAGIIYVALLAAIDKDARELIRSIWQEIKFRF